MCRCDRCSTDTPREASLYRHALPQIEKALTDVADPSPLGAARIRKRILNAAALITEHPLAGQATDRGGNRRVELTPCPHILFYLFDRMTGTEVIVTRFRHAARRHSR